MADLSVFTRFKGFNDFQEAAQQKQLSQALMAAQIQKMTAPDPFDVKRVGQEALVREQMGLPNTPLQEAAKRVYNASTQNVFTDAEGNVMMKPSIIQRLSGQTPPVYNGGSAAASDGSFDAASLPQPTGGTIDQQLPKELPPQENVYEFTDLLPQAKTLGGKTKVNKEKAAIESGQKEVEAMNELAVGAAKASQTAKTMERLLPSVGYTGFGGSAVGLADRMATAAGYPDFIKGDVSAREAFKPLEVDAWVAATLPLKGALSNTEGSRFDKAISSLDTTKEGIRLRSIYTQALAQRAQEKASFFSQWFNRTGDTSGAGLAWEKYADANPVITDDFASRAKQAAKTGVSINEVPAVGAVNTESPDVPSEQRILPNPKPNREKQLFDERKNKLADANNTPISIPMGAAKKLQENPQLAPYFDAKYGAGASKRVLGR